MELEEEESLETIIMFPDDVRRSPPVVGKPSPVYSRQPDVVEEAGADDGEPARKSGVRQLSTRERKVAARKVRRAVGSFFSKTRGR